MAYEPNEWSCGDTVTAEKLNAMERGISDMNADYVPTEWVCGDVITAEKLNHMEQGIANGCEGGGSDFSTAQVTVNSSTEYGYELQLSNYYDYEDTGVIVPNISSRDIDTSIILDAVLYKGQAMCILRPTGQNTPNVSVSGNIQEVEAETYIITGDCTITIS